MLDQLCTILTSTRLSSNHLHPLNTSLSCVDTHSALSTQCQSDLGYYASFSRSRCNIISYFAPMLLLLFFSRSTHSSSHSSLLAIPLEDRGCSFKATEAEPCSSPYLLIVLIPSYACYPRHHKDRRRQRVVLPHWMTDRDC